MKEWIKSILILPFNVTITIPFLILYFSKFKYNIPSIFQISIGIIILFIGLFLLIWTILLFEKIGKGTLAPWSATKHLVIQGPFKYTRNPMITGVLCILTAEATILNSNYLLYWTIFFFLLNCVYFKLFEEKQLEQKFGDEYIKYKKATPAWVPNIFFRKK